MQQLSLDDSKRVVVDCIWSRLPKSFYELKPDVYKDGDIFCCLLGPNFQQGIFGTGSTTQEAIQEWDCHLKEIIDDPRNNSETLQFARSIILRSHLDSDDLYTGEF